MNTAVAFPNYLQMRRRVPERVWVVGRIISVSSFLVLCALLFVKPHLGLTIFWRFTVPVLPAVWLIVPGLWRNLCPLAAANQVPRGLGITRGKALPDAMLRTTYAIGLVAFVVLISLRRVVFDTNGPATALLLLAVIALAFTGGLAFKGKAGWCSSVCPLLPVQRLYGETPFVLSANRYCKPCVGCAKNCYDFNPKVAKLADLDDDDKRYRGYRAVFAGGFPGFIVAFFSLHDGAAVQHIYTRYGVFIAVSLAVFVLLDTFGPLGSHRTTALFAALAINLFYWHVLPIVVGGAPFALVWTGRAAVGAASVVWLSRTFAKEKEYLREVAPAHAVIPVEAVTARRREAAGEPVVDIEPEGVTVAAPVGTSLLELVERAGLSIEAGCRMGVCGSDPVAVLDGGDSLSPLRTQEADTIARLGLGGATRMACMARVNGDCRVSLDAQSADAGPVPEVPAGFELDDTVRSVVVIGNGIGGSSAVDHLRRLNPDCELHVVAAEPRRLYNRMAITRLVYGRSAMHGLFLLPEDWYDKHNVTCWLNTRARRLDREARVVQLATGEQLHYDRLILATGASAARPRIPGIDLAGCFVLRDADDAIAVRAYAQHDKVHRVVVAGGGLLGIESAYAVHKMGLAVTLLNRGPYLLGRELDAAAATLLRTYLENLGIDVLADAELASVTGERDVEGVGLLDGRAVAADMLLVCTGNAPSTALAQEAGLTVDRGVVVDEFLRTDDPNIFAVGDAAQPTSGMRGLWPDAAHQGEVAARNALGAREPYAARPIATILKVEGFDVMSAGRINAVEGDEEIVVADDTNGYRKLVLHDGRVAGAIVVGYPLLSAGVQDAVRDGRDVTDARAQLAQGDWSTFD
ncbi:MAG TPA: FAD-dependent oxidoreductase [Acidimicrobiales bacterium]|nr:FAD-dependent oxidoreductase [Acidimicrobiales bacterium]